MKEEVLRGLCVPLDEEDKTPLYAQIYEYIREEIKAGVIPAYTRLPSTRGLSASLGVSRSTVQLAYDQLCSEGYLDAEPCRGYYAARVDRPDWQAEEPEKAETGGRTRSCKDAVRTAEPLVKEGKESSAEDPVGEAPLTDGEKCIDFSLSGTDMTAFPYNTWRRLTREVFSDETGRVLEKGEAQGEWELRREIIRYLHEARGVKGSPEQVIVGAGNEYLLLLLHQILGRPELCAMESVTYVQAARVLSSAGCRILPVEMDSAGMRPDALARSGARLAYCMPSHQFPTGIVMPAGRRAELLNWASEADAYLIEDDYDSEFRYHGRPIPTLQGAGGERVIYLGTFSRDIAPAIRVSYLVLPESLLEAYRRRCGFYACTVPRADQLVLAHFLRDGSFERHLNRLRAVYRARHDALLEGLSSLRDSFSFCGENAGVQLMVKSRTGRTEEELIRQAGEASVCVHGLSDYRVSPGRGTDPGAVLLGFAGLSEEKIREGCERLTGVWRRGTPSGSSRTGA